MKLSYDDIDTSLAPAKMEEMQTNNLWDYYVYREYDHSFGHKAFDSIIDIGANSGSVGLITRVRFPTANLYSFDPNPISYASNVRLKSLFEKANGRRGGGTWEVYNLGLGDGNPVYLYQDQEGNLKENLLSDVGVPAKKPALGAVFAQKEGSDFDGTTLDTITFKSLLELTKVDLTKNLSLKIDCECCESWLYSQENLNLLRKFRHIAGEIHFPPHNEQHEYIKPDHQFNQCSMCVDVKAHKDAFTSLSDVFDIKFFKGNPKKGICHVILTRKEDNIKGIAGVHY